MQLYADVIKKENTDFGQPAEPALGAAITGQSRRARKKGGYQNVFDAADAMGKLKDTVYTPNPRLHGYI